MLVSNKLFWNFIHIDVSLYVGILKSKMSYFTYIFSLDKSMVGDPSQLHLLASMQLHLKKLRQPSDKRAPHWVLELHRSPRGPKVKHILRPQSQIFIKIMIQASCSAKAENIQGKCLLPALNIRSLNKDRWVVFRNWKQPDPVLRTTQKQDLSKIPTNTGDSEGTPDSTRERTQASWYLDFSLRYSEQETQSA